MQQEVILVNEQDEQIGTMEKMEAHRKGILHRAFSVFIFNEKNEMLLQQRAITKYHSGGLWSNACCSHPLPGEQTNEAAERRLKEELGIQCELMPMFNFMYNATFDNGLTENEYDHVFYGKFNGPVFADPIEAETYAYKSLDKIERELKDHPQIFTVWFRIAFPRIIAILKP